MKKFVIGFITICLSSLAMILADPALVLAQSNNYWRQQQMMQQQMQQQRWQQQQDQMRRQQQDQMRQQQQEQMRRQQQAQQRQLQIQQQQAQQRQQQQRQAQQQAQQRQLQLQQQQTQQRQQQRQTQQQQRQQIIKATRNPTPGEIQKGFTGRVTADGRALVKFQNRILTVPASRISGLSAKLANDNQRKSNWTAQKQSATNARIKAVASGKFAVSKEATGFLGSKRLQLQNAPYQKVRNAPTTIDGREYSGHALDQMQNRGLMPTVVENAIRNGVASPGKYAGSTQYLDTVNRFRVIVNSETGRVVTVIPGVK